MRASRALLLVAIVLAGAAAGWVGAWLLAGDDSPAPATSPDVAQEAALPEEARAPAPPPPPPEDVPAEPEPTPPPPETVAPEPRPEPEPEPEPPPEPSTETEPGEPQPAPEPTTPTTPTTPSPPAPRIRPPSPPPRPVRIPAGQVAGDVPEARAALAAARAAAPPGSTTAADAGRLLALWQRYLGPGTEGVPAGRKATVARALRDNAWWFSRWPSPPAAVLLRDPDGILLTYKRGQGFAVNPVATTGRWLGLNVDVSPAALASTLLEMSVARRAGDRSFTLWEYYDHPDDPGAIQPGASGMAQARVALVMAHAFRATGERRFLDAALGAVAALAVPVDRGGALSMVSVHAGQAPAPWYVERAYPGESPWRGAALNGFMVSLLNLRGAATALDAAAATAPGPRPAAVAALARALADRGVATLARQLPDHDSGSWSYYGLFTHGRPWRTYLADLNYHCYHIRLLRQLDPLHPGAGLGKVADRWQGYVEAARLSCPPR